MDVGSWLRELDLGQYEAAFRDNAVDGVILSKLTTDDLKEIGVVAVGHRRRLLEAIAALDLLGDSFGVSPPPSVASAGSVSVSPAASAPAAAASTASAEHRPITVMFCDLVGSTSIAAKLDPEDWRNLVGSYLDAASTAVTSLGGHVLKKLGDGLMALFGYPQAQENDGERAVRAALAIQRALADLNARNATSGAPELAARIGLESGRVVVDSTGEIYGDAPNVAARVQSAAAPGEIWITRAVHRQIAGLFVAEDKGEHELKGVPEKTQLYRIVRVSGGARRGGSRAPTPLVGRAEELDLLTRRWERSRRGEGQLSLIVGEPGLGKSRLIEEFRARGDAAHLDRMGVIAIVAEHAAPPRHGMGPSPLRRRRRRWREAARRTRGGARLRRARSRGICVAARPCDRRAAAAGSSSESVARRTTHSPARGARSLGAGRRPRATARARL